MTMALLQLFAYFFGGTLFVLAILSPIMVFTGTLARLPWWCALLVTVGYLPIWYLLMRKLLDWLGPTSGAFFDNDGGFGGSHG